MKNTIYNMKAIHNLFFMNKDAVLFTGKPRTRREKPSELLLTILCG